MKTFYRASISFMCLISAIIYLVVGFWKLLIVTLLCWVCLLIGS